MQVIKVEMVVCLEGIVQQNPKRNKQYKREHTNYQYQK